MKTRLLIIIGVVLTISASIVLLNYYHYEHELALRNMSGATTPEHLRGILFDCDCEKRIKANPDTNELCLDSFTSWHNSTHYIDNNVCKFLEIHEGFIIPTETDQCPNTMIVVDGKCMYPEYGIDPPYSLFFLVLISVILIVIFGFYIVTKKRK